MKIDMKIQIFQVLVILFSSVLLQVILGHGEQRTLSCRVSKFITSNEPNEAKFA